MYFFMYVAKPNTNWAFGRWLALLALCGAAMGLAIATKWQGVYAALGLPFLFFPAWFKLLAHNKKQAWITFAACFGFFIALPIAIYMLSYIPFVLAESTRLPDGESPTLTWGIRTIWQNQIHMFSYHSGLVANHPFASNWWSWPLLLTPIWLYVSDISDGVRAGITSFGNPAVWWFGTFAVAFAIYALAKKRFREPDLTFLLVALAAQFLPWIFVGRLTFIYHFFPSVPFMVLIIAWYFQHHVRRRWVFAYCALVLALFMLFYPVLSGAPISVEFVREYLRWLPGWIFV